MAGLGVLVAVALGALIALEGARDRRAADHADVWRADAKA